MIILGIDPGLVKTGYGIIKVKNNDCRILDFGIVCPNRKGKLSERLSTIYNDLSLIVDRFKPNILSIEEIFFGKNVKSALLLGHARGIPMLLSADNGLALFEFSARKIKQSLTGNGNATKEQVQFMVKNLLSMDKIPEPIDASDALAIAICYKQNFRI